MRAVRLRREYSIGYIIVNGSRESSRLMQVQKAEGGILPDNDTCCGLGEKVSGKRVNGLV